MVRSLAATSPDSTPRPGHAAPRAFAWSLAQRETLAEVAPGAQGGVKVHKVRYNDPDTEPRDRGAQPAEARWQVSFGITLLLTTSVNLSMTIFLLL